jgi:hypothetical protein
MAGGEGPPGHQRAIVAVRDIHSPRCLAYISSSTSATGVPRAPGARAGRSDVELAGVPRIDEFVWVSRVLARRVKAVLLVSSWLVSEAAGHETPWIWLGAGDAAASGIVDEDGSLRMPERHVEELGKSDWTIEDNS